MKRLQIIMLSLLFPGAAILFTSPALAQSPDAAFASDAASGAMVEVKLAQLAQQKSANPIVIDFGQRMEDDRSVATDHLSELALKQNISIPSQMNTDGHDAYDRLSKLSAASFDRAYIKIMIQYQQAEVSNFKKEADSGKDPGLKKFATETLPTIQQSLELAQEIAKAMSNQHRGTAVASQNES